MGGGASVTADLEGGGGHDSSPNGNQQAAGGTVNPLLILQRGVAERGDVATGDATLPDGRVEGDEAKPGPGGGGSGLKRFAAAGRSVAAAQRLAAPKLDRNGIIIREASASAVDPLAALEVGSLVEVASSTFGWTWAVVAEIAPSQITVRYGERTRVVLTGPAPLEHERSRRTLRNPLAAGDWVEVYSKTFNDWIPAKLRGVAPAAVEVEYAERARVIKLGDDDHNSRKVLRKPTVEQLRKIRIKRQQHELRAKQAAVQDALSEDDRLRMKHNIEQLHRLENDYEKVREELTLEQQAVFEHNLQEMREKCAPDKLASAVKEIREEQARVATLERQTHRVMKGTIFGAGFTRQHHMKKSFQEK